MTRYAGCSPAAEIHPTDAGLHLAAISLGVQHCIPWVEVWRQGLLPSVHNAVTQRHRVCPASACRASRMLWSSDWAMAASQSWHLVDAQQHGHTSGLHCRARHMELLQHIGALLTRASAAAHGGLGSRAGCSVQSLSPSFSRPARNERSLGSLGNRAASQWRPSAPRSVSSQHFEAVVHSCSRYEASDLQSRQLVKLQGGLRSMVHTMTSHSLQTCTLTGPSQLLPGAKKQLESTPRSPENPPVLQVGQACLECRKARPAAGLQCAAVAARTAHCGQLTVIPERC